MIRQIFRGVFWGSMLFLFGNVFGHAHWSVGLLFFIQALAIVGVASRCGHNTLKIWETLDSLVKTLTGAKRDKTKYGDTKGTSEGPQSPDGP